MHNTAVCFGWSTPAPAATWVQLDWAALLVPAGSIHLIDSPLSGPHGRKAHRPITQPDRVEEGGGGVLGAAGKCVVGRGAHGGGGAGGQH